MYLQGISCQDFAKWKEENNPDNQAAGLEQHLAEHGISCPACNFRYTLTKGNDLLLDDNQGFGHVLF